MRREIQAVLLVLFGGAVLRITLAGTYVNYVKPGMKPFLLGAAAILLGLGVAALLDVLRGRDEPDEAAVSIVGADADGGGAAAGGAVVDLSAGAPAGPHVHADSHGHSHDHLRIAWLLVLPVAAIFLVAPGPLGAYTATRATASVAQPAGSTGPAPLPAGDPVPLALDDYAVRAVWDDGRTLEGRTVELVGFVAPTANGWDLARMSVACCAADAVTIKVRPVGDVPALPADTWVSVIGTYNPGGGTGSADTVPWLDVQRVVPVPQPANPYL